MTGAVSTSPDHRRRESWGGGSASGFEALAAVAPALQLIAPDPTQTDFVIRGMATSRPGFEKIQSQSLVGLYLDDIPLALSSYNPNFRLVDIAGAEVVPGPQSVLYGLSASTGVVRILTRSPDLTGFSGRVQLMSSQTVNGGLGDGASAVANVPLVRGRAALRLVAYRDEDAGYIDNPVLGRTDTNRSRTSGGRLRLAAQLDADTALDLTAAYQAIDEADGFTATSRLKSSFQRNALRLEPAKSHDGLASASLTHLATGVEVKLSGAVVRTRNRVAPEIGGEVNLFARLLNPAAAAPVYDTALHTRTRSLSRVGQVEFRSRRAEGSQWVAGLNVSNTRRALVQTIDQPGFDRLTGVDSRLFGVATDRLSDARLMYSTRVLAGFGRLAIPLPAGLRAQVGLRAYTAKLSGDLDFRGIGEGGVDRRSPQIRDSGLIPEFDLTLRPTAGREVYLRVARGRRLGGFNTFVSPVACGADLAALGLSSANPTFDSDGGWSYEAGVRTRSSVVGAELNLSAFQQDWSHVQTAIQLACGFNTILNGGSMRSRGLEMSARLEPAPGLHISSSATYVDSRFGSETPPGVESGARAPFTPRFAASVGMRQDIRLGSRSGFVGLDYRYTGARFDSAELAGRRVMPAFGRVDLRAGIDVGSWSASVFAANLGNRAGVLNQIDFPFSQFPGKRVTYERPRTFGIAVQRDF